jgi:choline dehydrogenase-like flavoprotein
LGRRRERLPGGDGPLPTQLTRLQDPLVEAYAEAGQAAGYPTIEDYNGAQQEGFGRWQMTIRKRPSLQRSGGLSAPCDAPR